MPILVAYAGLLGLAIGSFGNVVAYRLPLGRSLVAPASSCPHCGASIRHRHNVPVLGWLALRGRCADCAAPISSRYPIVEVTTGGPVRGSDDQARSSSTRCPRCRPTSISRAAGVVLSLIDFDSHRLPNAIIVPSYADLGRAVDRRGGLAARLGEPGAGAGRRRWPLLLLFRRWRSPTRPGWASAT